MKIKEFLEAHKGQIVHIGFGSSFVYCDYVTDETFIEIEHISDRSYKNLFVMKDKTLKVLGSLRKQGKTRFVETSLERWRKDNNREPTQRVINNFGDMYDKLIATKEQAIKNYDKAIESFIPFLDVTVEEEYPSELSSATICIGKEDKFVCGDYWDREEYLKGVGKWKANAK